jgi:hypothetical protein
MLSKVSEQKYQRWFISTEPRARTHAPPEAAKVELIIASEGPGLQKSRIPTCGSSILRNWGLLQQPSISTWTRSVRNNVQRSPPYSGVPQPVLISQPLAAFEPSTDSIECVEISIHCTFSQLSFGRTQDIIRRCCSILSVLSGRSKFTSLPMQHLGTVITAL